VSDLPKLSNFSSELDTPRTTDFDRVKRSQETPYPRLRNACPNKNAASSSPCHSWVGSANGPGAWTETDVLHMTLQV
jgi:hypothetical protein